MRPGYFCGSVVAVCTLALAARAAEAPVYEEKVITRPVEVRSGPSDHANYYSTSKLKPGDRVKIVTNAPKHDGWLAIVPPAGSFSWVSALLVKQEGPKTGYVVAEDAPVLIGSSLIKDPPRVKTYPLRRGTLVDILDKPLECNDGSRWLPIKPHVTEVRYIPASAVQPSTAAAKAPAGKGKPGAPAADPSLVPPDPAAAEGGGKATDAKQVALAGNEQAKPSPVRSYYGKPTPNTWVPPGAAVASPAPARAPVPSADGWSGPGLLEKTTMVTKDNQVIYRLRDSRWQHITYVIAQPGLSLDPFIRRKVYLFGSTAYRSEAVRANFLTAKQVREVK
jgi:hypothetical protein